MLNALLQFMNEWIWPKGLALDLHEQIQDILYTPEITRLGEFEHHMDCTRLEHSLHVSYFSYRICRRLRLDARSAARAGLLHDLFYHEWKQDLLGYVMSTRKKQDRFVFHPRVALQNAERLTQLNDIERDIILKHMWPWFGIPRYRESFVVTMVDKLCATMEVGQSIFAMFRNGLLRVRLFRRRRSAVRV